MKIIIKLRKPVCRTPIKPMQKHKNDTLYTRKPKHQHKEYCVSTKY